MSSDDVSPLWCANDEPHAAHSRRNEFNGTDYCTGRPSVSSNDVTITEMGDGWLEVAEVGHEGAALRPAEVVALRARFAAERMPEDVQKLVTESRQTQGYSEGDLRSLVRALAAALEAAYSQKAEAWDEGANAELARARSQGADDPGIPHPMNPYRKGAVDGPR